VRALLAACLPALLGCGGEPLIDAALPADAGAPGAAGRFLHLEQSRAVRDEPAAVLASFREALGL